MLDKVVYCYSCCVCILWLPELFEFEFIMLACTAAADDELMFVKVEDGIA